MSQYLEPTDEREVAVLALLREAAAVGASTSARFSAGEVKRVSQRTRRSRSLRTGLLAVTAALTLAAALLVPLVVDRGARRPVPAAHAPDFLLLQLNARPELRSAESGRVVRVLRGNELAGAIDEGFSLSPDDAYIYYVRLIGADRTTVNRLSLANGRSNFVADGASPSVSPNGKYLAYSVGSTKKQLAVRNLATGATRIIDLSGVLPADATLFDGQVVWLGDDDEIVVNSSVIATVLSSSTHPTAAATSCTNTTLQHPKDTCLVVVHLDAPSSGRLSTLAVPQFADIWSDISTPTSILISVSNGAPQTLVERVNLARPGGQVTGRSVLPPIMPVAFDPSGSRVLYLSGNNPPSLWLASLESGHLENAHELSPDEQFSDAVW